MRDQRKPVRTIKRIKLPNHYERTTTWFGRDPLSARTAPRIDWGSEHGAIEWLDLNTGERRRGQIWSPAPTGLWVIPCERRHEHEVANVHHRGGLVYTSVMSTR